MRVVREQMNRPVVGNVKKRRKEGKVLKKKGDES